MSQFSSVVKTRQSNKAMPRLRSVARDLFLNSEDTLEQIGQKLEINQSTLSKWSAAEGWADLRRSMQMGDTSLAVGIQRQLRHLQEKADKQGVLGSVDADIYLKLVKAYKELQGEQSFGSQVRTLTNLMRWMAERQPEVARMVVPLIEEYRMKLAKEAQTKSR